MKSLNIQQCEPAQVSVLPTTAFSGALLPALGDVMGKSHTFLDTLSYEESQSGRILKQLGKHADELEFDESKE